jgi:hypothetical protein
VRASLINGAILVAVMVIFRLGSGGFHENLGDAIATAFVSAATCLPVVFVMEEVLFRGLLDPTCLARRGNGIAPRPFTDPPFGDSGTFRSCRSTWGLRRSRISSGFTQPLAMSW